MPVRALRHPDRVVEQAFSFGSESINARKGIKTKSHVIMAQIALESESINARKGIKTAHKR